MELRVLQYFLAVAREENFTKAAQSLHVSQPTLSRQIAQLEEELGVILFDRNSRNIALTEDGMILKRRAQELVSLAEKTRRDLSHRERELTGSIAIGSGEFQSTRVLSQIIAAFCAQHPLVQYEIYSGNSDNIRDYTERGLLDVSLIAEPVDIRKYDFLPMPLKEQWGVWVRSESPLAKQSRIRPEDLAGQRLIVSSRDFVKSIFKRWFGDYANHLQTVAYGNLLYNQVALAQQNMGVVLGIRLDCSYDGLQFVPLDPAFETNTVLAWKKEQVFTPTTAAFLAFAQQYIKSM